MFDTVSPMEVAELLERVRPVSLATQRALPVVEALRPVLPGGLPRGSTIQLPPGEPSLLLGLLAAPSAAGSWAALVGLSGVGGEAAAASGVDLGRLALIPDPGPRWATVVSAALDGIDLVVVRAPEGGPGSRLRTVDARRLSARARVQSRVLLVAGTWPEGADLTLRVIHSRWDGLGPGCGHLRRRWVEVESTGRRGGGRPRWAGLWLPGDSGAPEPGRPTLLTRNAI